MRQSETVVMYDSPEAAKPITVEGWVSRRGYFYQEEHMARYDGCTHRICDCGNLMERAYSKCDACRAKARAERYAALPKIQWDGNSWAYCEFYDRWFGDADELTGYLDGSYDGEERDASKLRLFLGEPQYARLLDEDHFTDELAEDEEPPSELLEAMKAFNAAVEAYGKPLSWACGTQAVTLASEVPA